MTAINVDKKIFIKVTNFYHIYKYIQIFIQIFIIYTNINFKLPLCPPL